MPVTEAGYLLMMPPTLASSRGTEQSRGCRIDKTIGVRAAEPNTPIRHPSLRLPAYPPTRLPGCACLSSCVCARTRVCASVFPHVHVSVRSSVSLCGVGSFAVCVCVCDVVGCSGSCFWREGDMPICSSILSSLIRFLHVIICYNN